MATLADLNDLDLSDYMHDGISFLPELEGKIQAKHPYLYWEFYQKEAEFPVAKQAIRSGNWKAVRFPGEDRTELYRLDEDPGETKDLSQKHPEETARMNALMTEAHIGNNNYPFSNYIER